MSSFSRIVKKPVIWVVFLCFILLPFISWLYVKRGIEFRQTALRELAQNIQVDSCSPFKIDKGPIVLDSMKGKVWVFFEKDEIKTGLLSEILKTLFAQNSGKNNLGIILCGDATKNNPDIPEYSYSSGFVLNGSAEIFECLKTTFINEDTMGVNRLGFNTFVMDVNGRLRNGYELDEKENVRKLIQHVTVLLPEYKREKPVLIRQQGY